ncbi:unnamed protein product [Heligmosomoides polygyrus]|uniref:DHC_N1 domain-containing protein n=1 Tax=Heligmosomoides polygyrus TaxID=6339 RepID=A0A183GLT1_HELPZ|nr:unnamed protein product [Heligmosomoides polygyrus]
MLPKVTTVDEAWKHAIDLIIRAACFKLDTRKPGRRWVDKQAWLWTDDVREKVREEKLFYHIFIGDKTTYQTTDESKREITIALNIWKQSLEAENKRLKEVLPAVQKRYEALVKQRNVLVENVNKLREALHLAPYITEVSEVLHTTMLKMDALLIERVS